MKHGALTERSWIAVMSGSPGMGEADYFDTFQVDDEDHRARWKTVCEKLSWPFSRDS